jgi:hypothetical protein
MRAMRRLVLVLIGAAALVAPGVARADHWQPGACGLPTALPLQVEYAESSVSPLVRNDIFAAARPPLVLASSGPTALELRGLGAHVVFWQMKLERLVGTTGAPWAPEVIDPIADNLYGRAVAATGCATPSIALNELQGNWLRTPWSLTYSMYRSNVLQLLRRLHERGAHPYLMVTTSPRPFTGSPEAVAWWQQASRVSDLVLQVHFDGRSFARLGPILASRGRRRAMRRVLERFEAIGIPSVRLGLLHGFQSGRGYGGREGLPLPTWLRVVKWEELAAKQVAGEWAADGKPFGSDWSWGWGDFPAITPTSVDPDKPVTACVWLWARDPRLCDGPGRAAAYGAPFDSSVTEGQIALPPEIQCSLGGGDAIERETLERLAAVGGGAAGRVGRKTALSALLSWLLDRRSARIAEEDVLLQEETILQRRFGGDRAAYEAALAGQGASPTLARAVIADELRRRAIARSLPRGQTLRTWTVEQQRRALESIACARDELPTLGFVDLTRWLPFLRAV